MRPKFRRTLHTSAERAAAAFSDLFDENYADVWRFVRRRVDSAGDADDLTAEVFTTAWRRFDDLPAPAERRLWLFGVARNVLLNHHRSTARRQRLVDRLGVLGHRELDHQNGSAHDHLAPHNIVDVTGGDDALRRALSRLSTADRDLLIMRAWDQLSVTEIATLLECSPNAVSVRLHKARRRLRNHLNEQNSYEHQKDPERDGDEACEPVAKGDPR